MASFERFDLQPPDSSVTPERVTRRARGPARLVDLDEAATLAEAAMSTDDQVMRVLSFAEVEAGWAFALQSPRYLETRSWKDMVIGHGLTFVERQTGDVYSSGSGQSVGGTVLGFSRAVADGTGPAQLPVNEQLRPAIDLYYTRLLRAATAEPDQAVRDRFWIHVLDALRLRRLALANGPSDDLWRATRAVHDALVEFPLLGPAGVQIHSAFDALERAVATASS